MGFSLFREYISCENINNYDMGDTNKIITKYKITYTEIQAHFPIKSLFHRTQLGAIFGHSLYKDHRLKIEHYTQKSLATKKF